MIHNIKIPASLLLIIFASCVTIGSGSGLSLIDAIEQTGEKIAGELPKGSRVAIAAFESVNENLSDYIMEELTGALFDRGIEVADRQNLEYIFKELNFQMGGEVSDESAKSIGKFLAADTIITGQLLDLNGLYRYRTNAINVETGVRTSVIRLDIRSDNAIRRMITALANQKTTIKTSKYGVSADIIPKTAGTFLDRGIMFASRGDYETAIADINEVIRLNPNMAAAYHMRGRVLYASVSKISNISTSFSFSSISTEGKVTTEQKRVFDLAIIDFNTAIRLEPDNAFIYLERGVVYMDIGDLDRSISDFTQALRIDPNYVDAYNSRGNAYYINKDYDRAISNYNQALRIDPNYIAAYNNRGNAYYINKDYDRAIADQTQALQLDPNFIDAYINRGEAYREKKDYDRAIADYNQALRIDSNYARAYITRSFVHYEKKDYDKIISDCNQVIRLSSDNDLLFVGYSLRGYAYILKNDYTRAIADFEAALRINPNDSNTKQLLDAAREARGR
jgi:tetratricopeptide (TPR) repeat protein